MAISLSHKNKNSDMDALKISKFRLLLPIQYKVQNIFNSNDSSAKNHISGTGSIFDSQGEKQKDFGIKINGK